MRPEDRVKKWIRASVRASSVYHIADASGLIKLDAMENPYPWPEHLRDAWLERLRNVELNRYPDPAAAGLKLQLSRTFSIPDHAEILLGNGSDEIIQIIVSAMAGPGITVLAPEPSFGMYRAVAEGAGVAFAGVPLRPGDFDLDMDAMLTAIERNQPAAIFIAWPNNPTGNLFEEGAVERIAEAAPGIVVVDEAYHAFAGASLMSLLDRHDNVLLMRTLSKLGLAGLRLGFLAGPRIWLREFEKLRLPYNVGALSQASAGFFLEHIDVLQEQTRRLREDRQRMLESMRELTEITVWPSAGNFLLFRTEVMRAVDVYEQLRHAGVLIRRVENLHPLLAGCLRVTVGTAAENSAFIQALSDILARR